MMRKKALFIAEEFIKSRNPEKWNGYGDKPESFDSRMFFCETRIPYRVKFTLCFHGKTEDSEDGESPWHCVCTRWDYHLKKKQKVKFSPVLNNKEAICDLILSVV